MRANLSLERAASTPFVLCGFSDEKFPLHESRSGECGCRLEVRLHAANLFMQ